MKATRIEHGLSLAAPTDGYVRTPGLHMSDIYGALYKELDPKRFDKKDKVTGKPLPFDLKRMELGTTFEELLEPVLARRLRGSRRPGEFTTEEGIIYSPDHLFMMDDDSEPILGEFKLTWMSGKGCPHDPKFDKWMCQIKAYLYHLGLKRARLYAFFVNGGIDHDYMEHQPEFHAWDLVFRQMELDANWNMLKRFAIKRGILQP